MKKWIKPFLVIVALVVVGCGCFWWGEKIGDAKGYDKGYVAHAIDSNRVEATYNIALLNILSRVDSSEHNFHQAEELIKVTLEGNVIALAGLDEYGTGNVPLKKVAIYIREHPLNREYNPEIQKLVNGFVDKYDPQGKKN